MNDEIGLFWVELFGGFFGIKEGEVVEFGKFLLMF